MPNAVAWFDLLRPCHAPPPLSFHPSIHRFVIGTNNSQELEHGNITCLVPNIILKQNFPDMYKLKRDLQKLCTGPGKHYVVKAFAPWIFPDYIQNLVILDHDLWFRVQPTSLFAEFEAFSKTQVLGAVDDIMGPELYRQAPLRTNGGVQWMKLSQMRSGPYLGGLKHLVSSRDKIGYLGDQTLITHMSSLYPDWYRNMNCKWNRQMNMHFRVPSERYSCRDGCNVLHGNQPALKKLINLAIYGNSSQLKRVMSSRFPRLFQGLRDCFEED